MLFRLAIDDLVLGLAAMAIAAMVTPAAAEPQAAAAPPDRSAAEESPCAPYGAVAALLRQRYHELPVARMLSDGGFVIEILAAPGGASFTMLEITATADGGGRACLLATGSGLSFIGGTAVPGTAL
ncbi:hypothetical protein [Inquilinus sp. CA228]|uniref:hypothetical protein n=1 Tax=Inquilinus sp. CA228 TaxID=3455609 RepID=UPI003F8D4A03